MKEINFSRKFNLFNLGFLIILNIYWKVVIDKNILLTKIYVSRLSKDTIRLSALQPKKCRTEKQHKREKEKSYNPRHHHGSQFVLGQLTSNPWLKRFGLGIISLWKWSTREFSGKLEIKSFDEKLSKLDERVE